MTVITMMKKFILTIVPSKDAHPEKYAYFVLTLHVRINAKYVI